MPPHCCERGVVREATPPAADYCIINRHISRGMTTTEEVAGIVCYTTDTPPFSAILKHRYFVKLCGHCVSK